MPKWLSRRPDIFDHYPTTRFYQLKPECEGMKVCVGRVQSVIDDEIEKRLAEVTTWLRRNATFHPDPDEMGAVERAYWHFGYLSALQDMRAILMTKGNGTLPARGASRKDQ